MDYSTKFLIICLAVLAFCAWVLWLQIRNLRIEKPTNFIIPKSNINIEIKIDKLIDSIDVDGKQHNEEQIQKMFKDMLIKTANEIDSTHKL
jgi:hypothetical protein